MRKLLIFNAAKKFIKKSIPYLIIFWICFLLIKISLSLSLITQFISLLPSSTQYGKNILVVGIDEVDGTKRSDSIVVLHISADGKNIRALSIPRDTRVSIDKVGVSKINHSYAYGKIKLLKKTISDFLSIPIDNYVVVNEDGIKQLIDEIGGVTIQIDENMIYNDYAGGLHINFQKGERYMGGDDLLKFLRYRNNAKGDLGRIARQQEVFEILFEKIFKFRTLILSPKIISIFFKSVKTDLSMIEINNYLQMFLENREFQNIKFFTVPGSVRLIEGVSYWRPDIIYLDNLITKTFVDYKNYNISTEADSPDNSHEKIFISSKQISRATQQLDIDNKQEVKEQVNLSVEVLNGNGYKGVAKTAANFLKENGLVVMNVGNSNSFNYTNTLIVDWKGNVENSLKLARLLKINPENIVIYNRQDKPLDITLVLGKDWSSNYLEGLANNEATN